MAIFAIGNETKSDKKTLLVVNGVEPLSRLMERALRSSFGFVFTASDPDDATSILKKNRITHLLCDFYVGTVDVSAYALIEFWRTEFPEIERAVVIAKSETRNVSRPVEVDVLVERSGGIAAVVDALLASAGARQ